MRNWAQGGDLELGRPARWQQGKLEAPGVYILWPHFESIERFVLMYKERCRHAKKVRDREREDWKLVPSVGDFGVLFDRGNTVIA